MLSRLVPHACLAALLLAAAPLQAAGEEPGQLLEDRIVMASERVKPAVVHIEAIVRINDRRSQVTGSGVIWSADGLILTNQHVVDKAQKVEVTVPGRKRRYTARVLGTDKQTDIALLRIDPDRPLRAADFSDAGEVRVGQWVLAVGNPYGLDGTVSLGIVSAKGRNLEIPDLINEFIQTDAMIDRGSSGGPLVDLEGRVVGINSRGQGRGIGFTIPIATALDVVSQIEDGGVERGWLGVTIQPLDRDLAGYLGIGQLTGVVVNGVAQGSPAEQASLEAGDVITSFHGDTVEAEKEEDLARFQRQVARVEPGTRVKLAVLRKGKSRSVSITVGSQPNVDPSEAETDLGFHVQEITENLFREERLTSRDGAFVSFVARGSPAAEAGLFPGDVIERVNDASVRSLDAFEQAMDDVSDADRVLLRARRGADLKFLLLKRGAKPADPQPADRDAEAARHEND